MEPSTFDQVLEQGAISGRADFVYEFHASAYRWMMDQMQLRIPGYSGQYPVWAWQSPRPDLRWTMFREWARPAVLVEWAAPFESVLLSDFDLWHTVLNKTFLSPDGERHDAWDQRVLHETGRAGTWYDDLPTHLQAEVRQSWQQIFAFESLELDPDWWGAERWIQAVVPELRLDQVIQVRELSSRLSLPDPDDDAD
jgi:hypothetical protein